jgi:ribosomal protein L32
MMYQNGLVAVIKVNGKVLRESKEKVYIPFGSEYSILIKNLKSQQVRVYVSIDGTDAFGTQIVIDPNSEVELKRFIKNDNYNAGNKFKFIERTEAIEEYRGIKVDDSLIRIEYWTEKIQPVVDIPQFVSAGWFPVHDQSEVIIIKLCGKRETKRVVKPITVQTKRKCMTCGKRSLSNVSFCPQCGTALNLL